MALPYLTYLVDQAAALSPDLFSAKDIKGVRRQQEAEYRHAWEAAKRVGVTRATWDPTRAPLLRPTRTLLLRPTRTPLPRPARTPLLRFARTPLPRR